MTVAQARLRDILPAILNGLRAFGEVALPVDAAHTLFLRIFEFMPPPPPIADHEVRGAVPQLRHAHASR